MRTRQQIIDRINLLIIAEQKEVSTENFSLIQDKIESLEALLDKITISATDQHNYIPVQWLNKTIRDIIAERPKLTEWPETKKLLTDIAPNWNTHSTLFKPVLEIDYEFKIKLLGDNGVGKSSTVLRFCDGTFTESFISTIGVDFKIKQIDTVRLQIWDTAGEERFRTVTPDNKRKIDALILMFDTTHQETFSNIKKKWLIEANTYENALIFLVGTKMDLTSQNDRKVSTEEAQKFAESLNLPYIEISAKNNINVDELFSDIVTCLIDKRKSLEEQPQKPALRPGGGCALL